MSVKPGRLAAPEEDYHTSEGLTLGKWDYLNPKNM